jgi:ubiquinol-cytochrome c reductase cytochrome c subunit
MPPISALSGPDIDTVTAFVVELAGGATKAPEPATDVEASAEGNIDRGHDLFVGSDRLDNGGAACAACHTAGSVGNLGGNSLGPDLTNVFATLGGEAGLGAWLTNPPSQTMQPIFADDPMTDAEIADLVAFLADAPNQDEPPDAVDILLLVSLGGFVILIGGMAIAWRGMRQPYVDKLRTKR